MPIRHQGSGNQILVIAAAQMTGVGHYVVYEQEVEQNITVADLPTADPHVKGQLWSNAGVITISQG